MSSTRPLRQSDQKAASTTRNGPIVAKAVAGIQRAWKPSIASTRSTAVAASSAEWRVRKPAGPTASRVLSTSLRKRRRAAAPRSKPRRSACACDAGPEDREEGEAGGVEADVHARGARDAAPQPGVARRKTPGRSRRSTRAAPSAIGRAGGALPLLLFRPSPRLWILNASPLDSLLHVVLAQGDWTA